MTIETRFFELQTEIRAASDDAPRVAFGLAAPYNKWSGNLGGFREKIARGAFTRSLAEAASGERNIFALWSHSSALPLGSTKGGKLKLSEDERGLSFELDTQRLDNLQIDALADGDCRCSFGFNVREQQWADGEFGDERTLIDLDLSEISFVINPAYADTDAALRSLDEWKNEKREEEVASINTIERMVRVKMAQLEARER